MNRIIIFSLPKSDYSVCVCVYFFRIYAHERERKERKRTSSFFFSLSLFDVCVYLSLRAREFCSAKFFVVKKLKSSKF